MQMKPTFVKSKPLLRRARREEPDILGRVTAALALLAWLVLAGDALAQGTNQWAPAPVPQPAPSGQVWGGSGGGGAVYAPADLDQQLANGTLTAPVAPAPAGVPQPPVYAPEGTATSRLGTPVAPPPATAAPAYGYPAQPLGQPYAQTYPQAYPQPYAQPYALPGYGGYGIPYYGVPGLPGVTGPGLYPGIVPGLGGWGTPYGSPGFHGGVPFFGGSPFGFW